MASTTAQGGTPSYLIVGSGVFGTSTALHLKRAYPSAAVTLVDRDAFDAPARVAASWDWNKAVRADYSDIVYCALALEAQDAWRGDGDNNQGGIWKPFYHESGIYWISRTGIAQRVIDNYEKLGRKAEVYSIPVEEARKLYGGLFDEADYEGVENVLVNKTSGWADAKGALQRGTERAVELGVKYVTAEVAGLEFGSDGTCVGVRTADGEVLNATHTILSTGSFTPKLLDESARKSGLDALRAGDRIVAAGVTTGLTVLDDKTFQRFNSMPIGIQENPAGRGASNGSLPPNEEKQLKWWGQSIFRNTGTTPSGGELSSPPSAPDYAQWDIPQFLKDDIDVANKATFGTQGESWKLEKYRICWEAITPNEDFIISPHSAAKGLYVATCGSFHGYKFFPIIGKYVVQMLEGTLSPELERKWAWDREIPDGSKRAWWPRHELKDLW